MRRAPRFKGHAWPRVSDSAPGRGEGPDGWYRIREKEIITNAVSTHSHIARNVCRHGTTMSQRALAAKTFNNKNKPPAAAAAAAAAATTNLSVQLGESLGLDGGDDGLLEPLSVLVRGDGGRTLVHVFGVGVVPVTSKRSIQQKNAALVQVPFGFNKPKPTIAIEEGVALGAGVLRKTTSDSTLTLNLDTRS